MTAFPADPDDLEHRDEDEGGRPRVREFNDGLSPADRAEAILTTIINAKGGTRREGQVQMAREVATALSEQLPLLIQGGTGIGKALDIDTPIPTTQGFKRMGELEVGDFVFNEEGQAVQVTNAFAYLYGRECYKVTFSDGSSIIADAEHLWDTETVRSMVTQDPWAGASTLTTLEIKRTLQNASGRANHRIPVAEPLRTFAKRQPVHPYLFGAWLAGLDVRGEDAYAKGANISRKAQKVCAIGGKPKRAASLTEEEKHLRVRLVLSPDEAQYVAKLSVPDLGIPFRYLFGAETQRRTLMAGMLDVSGYVVGENQIRFQDHRQQVAEDFQSLASSLGYRASIATRPDAPGIWMVSFTTTDLVFRAEHKNARINTAKVSTPARRTIVSVEKVESRTVRCITVDSPRSLFLAGRTMVPTHNSIAYLAGALASGRQAVVAPHTKALQDQLRADLDLIKSAFPAGEKHVIPTPTYAIIKGRSSYVCLSKVRGTEEDDAVQETIDAAMAKETPQDLFSGPRSKLGKEVKALHEWADETATGERSEVPFPVSQKAWENVSTTSTDCTGKACPFYQDCFANIQRQLAFASDIIVVNQAFLAAWMKTPQILPDTVGAVLIDEAHEFNSVVADAFGSNVTPGRINHTVSRALTALTRADAKEQSEVGAQEAKDAADALAAKLVIKSKWDRTDMELPGQCTTEIQTALTKIARLREQAAAYISTSSDQEKAKKDNLLREIDNLNGDLKMILEGTTDDQVVWAEKGFQDKVGLRAARFDVSQTIFDNLTIKVKSVVFTSATLTIAGDFAIPAANFGFNKGPWIGKVVESPFDYETQGLIWMPDGMPEPGTQDKGKIYTAQVAKIAEKTALAAGGRTLVLCTSNASVKAIHEHLARALKKPGYQVLAQGVGDLSAKELAKRFTEDPHAVLIGTRTFWTGISVEGDTCAAVVIDKMPFPAPNDPIIKSRSDKADRLGGRGMGFKTVSLAEASLTLVQGAGRLVRTVRDRGVIVLCDPRINQSSQFIKGYAPGIMRDLPPFPVTRDEEKALGMLRTINDTANDAVAVLEVEDEAGE